MAIVKFPGRLHSHPSVQAAGNAAVGLWTLLACWAAATRPEGGEVPARLVRSHGTAVQIRRMVASGLAVETTTGYVLNAELFTVICGDSRPYIPVALRTFVYDRDGWRCQECGTTEDLSLDHIYPWSLGGPDTEENLRTLCRSCNSRKGARV